MTTQHSVSHNTVCDSRLSEVILKGIRKGNLRAAAALIVVMGSSLSIPATK